MPSDPSSDREPSALGSVLAKLIALALFAALLGLVVVLVFIVFQPAPVSTVSLTSPLPPSNYVPNSMPKLPLTYPASRTVDASDTYSGIKVDDPYRWLEDGKSPEVKDWLQAQNHLTREYLDALPGRAALEKRYTELLRIDTITAPSRAGDRYFYMKRRAEQEKGVLYWRSATDPNDPDHVLVDPNEYIGKSNAALGSTSVTLDGRLLAYNLKPNNADEATLYVRDVATGKDLPGEVIEGTKYGGASWMPDGSGFVYNWVPPLDPAHVAERPGLVVVKYHHLGTDPKNDVIIHEKTGDPTKFIGCSISRDGKWIFFEEQNGWDRNDLYYHPLNGEPTAALAKAWKPIVVGKPFLYSLDAWQGQGYILTNEDAPHFRLFKVALNDPSRPKWREIVKESPTAVLQGTAIIGNHIVLDQLENVVSKVDICDLEGKLVRHLDLPGVGSLAELEGEPERDEMFFGFVNFTQPLEIFRTSVTDPAQTLWAKISVPVDPSPYVVEQQWYASKDGTQVPMFIVHRKDMVMDGRTPFLMYGYGGFSVSQTPAFMGGWYPFLEAGGAYAMLNLRGGGEFGEQWHHDGMLLKKQNVFDDCIGAAEFLIKKGYTSPQHLALRGGSNGGLLVGAVVTQRPDLFRAAVCEVPLLDMIRYGQFGSGKTWETEYGSPDNPEQFKALFAYSPYHHIVPGTKYPALLMCTAENDDRVDPMHARKFVAKMQADSASDLPILLRLETESGHGGGDRISKTIHQGMDVWGFLIHELGANPPGQTLSVNASDSKPGT